MFSLYFFCCLFVPFLLLAFSVDFTFPLSPVCSFSAACLPFLLLSYFLCHLLLQFSIAGIQIYFQLFYPRRLSTIAGMRVYKSIFSFFTRSCSPACQSCGYIGDISRHSAIFRSILLFLLFLSHFSL